jgi:hypothetical protein
MRAERGGSYLDQEARLPAASVRRLHIFPDLFPARSIVIFCSALRDVHHSGLRRRPA